MSSSTLTRCFALLGLSGLAGCGFVPLHSGTGVPQEAFVFETGDSVADFRLREQLIRRLGPMAFAQYSLKTTLRISERAAAIADDGDTSRLNVIGTADWSVVDIATDTQLGNGTVEAFTSYSATGSTVATQTARDDARARLSVILADMIVIRTTAVVADPTR